MWLNPFIISRQHSAFGKHSAFSTQPAQQFGAVSTGILSSQVSQNKEARSQPHHRLEPD
jgi:hypothetical protein